MPALDARVIEDLTDRAREFLSESGEVSEISFLDAGGSAAVFRVTRGDCVQAVKVFDPALFQGPRAADNRRRLSVQHLLINHKCKSLIQTYQVKEAMGTAFIEMEYVDWPQLAKCLSQVPDEAVAPLIGQLVDAVTYLESRNIVHRDIKPENIHVSPDFQQLKLLDLGVAREFDSPEESDAALTDDGKRRPFLATAQYSSPEYLFRLDEPTQKLWRGLNIYQVGAVLHDLVKKEAIFQYEISLGNRWLIARAVLTKQPSFSDADSDRLSCAKTLSLRCLTKDIDTRLALVSWEDFRFGETLDPIAALRDRLSRNAATLVVQEKLKSATRLKFDREEYSRRIFEKVRTDLIGVCGTQLPMSMDSTSNSEMFETKFRFSPRSPFSIECIVKFKWMNGLHERTAVVEVGTRILEDERAGIEEIQEFFPILEACIHEGESEAIKIISMEIARLVGIALDQIEAAGNTAKTPGVQSL